MNQLILGDCLEVMRKMDSESIDLIYLDPPFFSNRNYEVIWGDKGEVRSFEDRWSGGIDHYISWLKERVSEMHRLLKPTGSIYLHCDWHADAYIRVYILDKIFGINNFRNELIWYYKRWTNVSKQFQNMHDTIFWYTKSNNFIFNKNGDTPSESQKRKFKKGWDQNVVKGKNGEKITQYIIYNREKFQKNCKPMPDAKLVYRETDDLKIAPPDVLDIPIINSQATERIGYPTQKPEDLIHKLIFTSSNEGDTILDPFVGGGTTIAVADKLGRNWIGIDQSVQAIKVSEFRLNKQQGIFSQPFVVQLHKYDYDTLFNQNPKIFETWIVERFGGRPNMKKGSDKGIDGKMQDGTPIQVKQSNAVGSMPIRQLITDARANDKMVYDKNMKEGKPIAYFIAFSFGKGAVQEVARLKNEENIIVQLVKVEDIVPIAKKPKLNVIINDLSSTSKPSEGLKPSEGSKKETLREIEFIAEAESDAGIEFYAFDFNYDEETKIFSAEQMLNKEGKSTYKFKPGTHTIAVKAVDSEGLEAFEVIKIKVNGMVERE